MFDISFSELMLIGIVALVVIGPERLPKVAKTVGHLLGRAQRYVNDVKGDIQREVELDELRKMKNEMESAARSMQTSMNQTEASLRNELQSPVDNVKTELDEFKSDFEPQMKSATAELAIKGQVSNPAPALDANPTSQPAVKSDLPEPKT